MKHNRSRHREIRLGTHGEDCGNWMPVSMLRLVGGLAALAAVLSVLSFAVFPITMLGVVFVINGPIPAAMRKALRCICRKQ